jgi:flagellar hook-length control protein FliK
MSVSGISFLSNAAASSDAGPAASAQSETHAAFANAMAGANKPAMKSVDARTQRDDGADRSKASKAKDDHDDDSKPEKADSAAPQPGNAVASPAAGAVATPKDDQPTKAKGDAAVRGAAGDASRTPAQATDSAPDMVAELVDPSFVAPVLAALNEAVAAGQGDKPATADPAGVTSDPAPVTTAQPAPQPDAASPLPTTAALMAARAAATPAAQTAEAREATPSNRKARDAAAADKTASTDSLSIDSPSTVAQTPTVGAPKSDAAAMPLPGASQQLANGGADRQLDLAKQGAWLDGLARDIASTGDSSSTLRFQVAPQHLGTVQVEMTRGADGAAVTLTASSESARTMLADARPQLVAEAKAQGIHIANAQVDVSADSRQPGSGSQPEQRHDPRGQTGFSSQMGSGGNDNGRSQTRSQPIAVNQTPDGRADAPAQEADSASAAEPADGMYA